MDVEVFGIVDVLVSARLDAIDDLSPGSACLPQILTFVCIIILVVPDLAGWLEECIACRLTTGSGLYQLVCAANTEV